MPPPKRPRRDKEPGVGALKINKGKRSPAKNYPFPLALLAQSRRGGTGSRTDLGRRR